MTDLSKTLVSLRSFSRQAPELREPVLVTHGHNIIGEFIPAPRAAQDDGDRARMGADPVESPPREGAPGRLGAPEPATRGKPDDALLPGESKRRGGKP